MIPQTVQEIFVIEKKETPIKTSFALMAELEHTWGDYYHTICKTFENEPRICALFDHYYYQSIDFKRKWRNILKEIGAEEFSFSDNFPKEMLKLKDEINHLIQSIMRNSKIHLNEIVVKNYHLEYYTLEQYQKLQGQELLQHKHFNEMIFQRIERIRNLKG